VKAREAPSVCKNTLVLKIHESVRREEMRSVEDSVVVQPCKVLYKRIQILIQREFVPTYEFLCVVIFVF
jgi:hypothetical protein